MTTILTEIEKIVNGNLRPLDDVVFTKMAEDKDFLEELLQVILGDYKLVVVKHEIQKVLSNLGGRTARIDTLCILGDHRMVNVEIQKADTTDHQRRVRYHASLITTNFTKPQQKFGDIPDVLIVYIAEFDIFNADLPLYHVERIVKETNEVVDNGLCEIYVNATCKDNSDVSKLMKVLTTNDAYNDKFPKTSDRKHCVLKQQEEKKVYSQAIQNLIDKAVDEKQKTITTLSEQNTALSDQNTALSDQIAALSGQNTTLSKQNTDLINENEMLKLELAKMKKNMTN